jgi:hypothetical protein
VADYNYLVFRNVYSEGASSLISRILYNETLANICADRELGGYTGFMYSSDKCSQKLDRDRKT